ncbi:uncharacterized protein LOC134835848 isoform X2 [Culicoides brevitarsis]|uniref:uncharacterized protein LOC134835848 isoform X2 n=1 Tax=Culicoides brevitarsis TaxID=469753 RepID=UPI00307C74A2
MPMSVRRISTQKMSLKQTASDRFPTDFRLPDKCRLCLIVHLKDSASLNASLKDYEKELYEMYGYEVGNDKLWHPESKICRKCTSQLEACYKFFCQLAETVTILSRQEPPAKRKRKISHRNNNFLEKTEQKSDDIEILEYIEDHTEDPEKVVISDDEEENIALPDKEDEDLDFDFTDDEKEEQATVEHEKFVNQILDSEAGVEGEIDCCLIDKRKLATQEGAVSEEVTVVLKDLPEETSNAKIEPKMPAKRKNSGSNLMHDTEYSVCQRCKVIYHRAIGSNSTKCLTCQEKMSDLDEIYSFFRRQ